MPHLTRPLLPTQVFTVFTQLPFNTNPDSNSNSTLADMFNVVLPLLGWPMPTWFSTRSRALHQARKFHAFAERSNGRLRVITTQTDLRAYVAQRQACLGVQDGCDMTAGLLGLEGAHALQGPRGSVEGAVAALEEFYAFGFRLVGLQHFFDNALGGSQHGEEQGGLTAIGRVRVCEACVVCVCARAFGSGALAGGRRFPRAH